MLLRHTRDELIALVERIRQADAPSEQALDDLVEEFSRSVTHPGATNLIFYPEKYFGKGHEPTSEEIVDKAIAHRAFAMPPSSE